MKVAQQTEHWDKRFKVAFHPLMLTNVILITPN